MDSRIAVGSEIQMFALVKRDPVTTQVIAIFPTLHALESYRRHNPNVNLTSGPNEAVLVTIMTATVHEFIVAGSLN